MKYKYFRYVGLHPSKEFVSFDSISAEMSSLSPLSFVHQGNLKDCHQREFWRSVPSSVEAGLTVVISSLFKCVAVVVEDEENLPDSGVVDLVLDSISAELSSSSPLSSAHRCRHRRELWGSLPSVELSVIISSLSLGVAVEEAVAEEVETYSAPILL